MLFFLLQSISGALMLPLRDEYPSLRTPIVNYTLIAVNIIVFIWQWMVGQENPQLVYQFALVPAQVTSGLSPDDFLHVLTSMFMHGGIAHIGGNMLYLWIFGDNIEDAMGHGRYLFFYLLGGVFASTAHILSNPNSVIPTVGASGAIAAVLGAYLILFPRARVLTLVSLGFFIRMTMVPAIIVLGLWFILQLFQGVLTLGGPDMGGVAFWAHIGGFVVGLVLARLFAQNRTYADYVRTRGF
jgi:membrane associated rhomboid family serine protease